DFDEDQCGKYFEHWTAPDERHDLSRLLAVSADSALNADQPRRAARRFIAAWQVDEGNLEALTTLAELLSNWKDPDDPTLLDRFIEVLYDQKRNALGKGDSSALLRLNLALGGIFETRGIWGPAETPRTAAYHYRNALRAYEDLRGSATNTPVYPGVHAHLANAYEHLGQKADAW